MRRWLNVSAWPLVTLVLVGCATHNSFLNVQQPITFHTTSSTQLNVYVADTTVELAEGLGNKPPLEPGQGMLFKFGKVQPQTFWMKDTEFAIDIVWLKQGQVVGVTANVQPEAPATPLSQYQQYPSPGAVDAVVELPAGFAAKQGITTGVALTLD